MDEPTWVVWVMLGGLVAAWCISIALMMALWRVFDSSRAERKESLQFVREALAKGHAAQLSKSASEFVSAAAQIDALAAPAPEKLDNTTATIPKSVKLADGNEVNLVFGWDDPNLIEGAEK